MTPSSPEESPKPEGERIILFNELSYRNLAIEIFIHTAPLVTLYGPEPWSMYARRSVGDESSVEEDVLVAVCDVDTSVLPGFVKLDYSNILILEREKRIKSWVVKHGDNKKD